MYVRQAERALRKAGLRVVIASVPKVTDADAGVNGYAIRSQAPAAGTRVPTGSLFVLQLAISFNGGPGGVGRLGVVPNLVGLPINRALAAATAVGLHVTVLRVAHRLSSDGVTGQSLTPGARVDMNDAITLHLG
jgi:beta-lactam-binding protein with PASTA domain